MDDKTTSTPVASLSSKDLTMEGPARIGELLIQEGFIKESDLN